MTCAECGGKCCKGFGVPPEYELAMRITGVPLALFQSVRELDPRRYFELHSGVTISEDGERFTVDPETPFEKVRDYLFIESVCTMLTPDGRCRIYETRPDMCKNFTAETSGFYEVPEGCKYE